MKFVIAMGYGAWQERVLRESAANYRLASYFYVKGKQFDPLWKQLEEQVTPK